jgi:hypothetical protein
MALTRDFKETVLARVQADPKFRDALLKEGVETMLAGDVDSGKAILRDYIKATVGFEQLGLLPVSMDTLLRWKMKPEVVYGNETAVQPGVQA